MHQDLTKLLAASRTAINVLRHNAEQLETIGQSSSTEREAIRRLNMAVQMVEYRIAQSRDDTGSLEA